MRFQPISFLLVLSLTSFCRADSALWAKIVDKVVSAQDYQLQYSYRGPKGRFRFLYSVVNQGPVVRTQILKGSDQGAGTVILFDPEESSDSVTIRSSFLTLRRSLEASDIADSSLYIPLYQQIIGKIEGSELTDFEEGLAGDLLIFRQGSTSHRVRVHPETLDIIQYSRYDHTELVELLTFTKIRWNQGTELSLER